MIFLIHDRNYFKLIEKHFTIFTLNTLIKCLVWWMQMTSCYNCIEHIYVNFISVIEINLSFSLSLSLSGLSKNLHLQNVISPLELQKSLELQKLTLYFQLDSWKSILQNGMYYEFPRNEFCIPYTMILRCWLCLLQPLLC